MEAVFSMGMMLTIIVNVSRMACPMSVAINDIFAGGDPDYDEISIESHPSPGDSLLKKMCSTAEVQELESLYKTANKAWTASEQYVDLHGVADWELQENAKSANEQFQLYREYLFEQHPEISSDKSRSQHISPAAPGKVGKVLGMPSMAAAAAMTMLMNTRSGYYNGVSDLNGDGLDHRFQEAFARAGGLAILPYDLEIDDMRATLRHLNNAHELYETPIFIHQSTTVQEARRLLIGQVPTAALYVKDDDGSVNKVITRSDVHMHPKNGSITDRNKEDDEERLNERAPISSLKILQKMVTAQSGIKAEAALEMMKLNRVHQLPIVNSEGEITHMFTAHRAKNAQNTKPFVVNSGLAAGVAIGIGDNSQTFERTEAALEAGAVYISLETAHAFRRDVIRKFKDLMLPALASKKEYVAAEVEDVKGQVSAVKKLVQHIRCRFKDFPLVIGFGTVTSPEAVRLLQALGVDVVKVGIGGGAQCATFDVTGVGGLPYGHVYRCGRAAAALGIQIAPDGSISSGRRFNIASSTSGAAFSIMGSALAPVAESASEAIYENGRWKKETFGEASSRAVANRLSRKGVSQEDIDTDEIHSEGKQDTVEIGIGRNGHAGGVVAKTNDAARSVLSYADSLNWDEGQKNVRIRKIAKTKTDKF